MTEPATTSERIRREARVVGLRDVRTPSLEAVERRRMQLWILAAVLLVALSTGAVVLSAWPRTAVGLWGSRAALQAGIVLLSAAFCVYAIEKELHLRKLARLLVEERVLTAALQNRLHELSLLLEAGQAMNSVLELDAVLDIILRSALELLRGKSGSVMLSEDGELVATCVHGNPHADGRRAPFGQGIAGRVAATREPLLINGTADPAEFPGLIPREDPVESAMSVPLVHRNELLGVLNVNAEAERVFSEYDLRALALFAEQAAGAIANAGLYEAERIHVAELLELNRMKSEFVALVSHELRTPLTSILGAAKTALLPAMAGQERDFLDIVCRQAKRLSSMLEELLAASQVDGGGPAPETAEVDLAALARMAARDFQVMGRAVHVRVVGSGLVPGDRGSLRRVLDNLLDNAHKYGAEPVRVEIESRDGFVVLSVLDSGPGVPAEERERIFDRFSRIDGEPDQSGLGLGLVVVRGLVGACGGRVWVEDAPGGGAAFRVELPAWAPQREAV